VCNEQEQSRAYLIETYLAGTNGEELALSVGYEKAVVQQVWQQLGGYLALLHQLPVEGFGELLPACEEPSNTLKGRDRFDRFLLYNIEQLESPDDPLQGPPLSILTLQNTQHILGILGDLLHQYKQGTFRFGLCHGDVSLKNCLVDQQFSGPQTSLVDWGCTTIDVIPHAEFNAMDISRCHLDSLLLGYLPCPFSLLVV